MNRIAKENPARRIQSFETVLPDWLRAEFTRAKKPCIPGQPAFHDQNIRWLAAAIVFGSMMVALAIGLAGRHEMQQLAARTQEPASTTTATHFVVPAQTPAVDQKPTPRSGPAVAPYAPRATLVKLPPPRAVLVRLPQWRIEEQRPVMMPYGLQVAARLKGRLPSADLLPRSGNAIGDTWAVGDSAWVWIVAPGDSSANWVDP
jgi:hypothetical protein